MTDPITEAARRACGQELHTGEPSYGSVLPGPAIHNPYCRCAATEREMRGLVEATNARWNSSELMPCDHALRYHCQNDECESCAICDRDAAARRAEEAERDFEAEHERFKKRGGAIDRLEAEVAAMRDLLDRLYGLVESGWLVRDVSKDGMPDWAMNQIVPVKLLADVSHALKREEAKNE